MSKIHFSIFLLVFGLNGFSQTLSNQFSTIATNNDMMGGALVVFCENGIIENIAIGKSDLARNIDMTVDSKYRIASISKTITTIAAMQLVEQNLLDLDANISEILGYTVLNPNHPNVAITPRMLMSHTSTIIDGSTYSSFLSATVNNNPIPNLSTILTVGGTYYVASQFNNTVPGTYFNYSNINTVILGTIVEKVSELRFDVYCKQNIFEPLGIDASFNVNDLSDIDEVAVLYRKPNGVWTPQADNFQGVQPTFNNLDGYIPGTNGGRFGPQGGLRCSAQDLAKIFLVLMNKGTFDGVTLLSEASCNAMFANEWTFNGNNGNNYYGLFRSWGLGIHRITSTPGNDVALTGSTFMLGHTGEAYGLVSDAYFDTIRKVGFVFMNNGVGIGYQTNNQSVFYTIEQQVFSAIENYGNIPVCLTASNDKIELNHILLYPNPSSDYIEIDGISIEQVVSIIIHDAQGKFIKNCTLQHDDVRINIADLNAGMYYFEFRGKRYSFTKI
jgi:CubicO group peptidase (beta-lactamase class C family)